MQDFSQTRFINNWNKIAKYINREARKQGKKPYLPLLGNHGYCEGFSFALANAIINENTEKFFEFYELVCSFNFKTDIFLKKEDVIYNKFIHEIIIFQERQLQLFTPQPMQFSVITYEKCAHPEIFQGFALPEEIENIVTKEFEDIKKLNDYLFALYQQDKLLPKKNTTITMEGLAYNKANPYYKEKKYYKTEIEIKNAEFNRYKIRQLIQDLQYRKNIDESRKIQLNYGNHQRIGIPNEKIGKDFAVIGQEQLTKDANYLVDLLKKLKNKDSVPVCFEKMNFYKAGHSILIYKENNRFYLFDSNIGLRQNYSNEKDMAKAMVVSINSYLALGSKSYGRFEQFIQKNLVFKILAVLLLPLLMALDYISPLDQAAFEKNIISSSARLTWTPIPYNRHTFFPPATEQTLPSEKLSDSKVDTLPIH